jgi:hypothetical protein
MTVAASAEAPMVACAAVSILNEEGSTGSEPSLRCQACGHQGIRMCSRREETKNVIRNNHALLVSLRRFVIEHYYLS